MLRPQIFHCLANLKNEIKGCADDRHVIIREHKFLSCELLIFGDVTNVTILEVRIVWNYLRICQMTKQTFEGVKHLIASNFIRHILATEEL